MYGDEEDYYQQYEQFDIPEAAEGYEDGDLNYVNAMDLRPRKQKSSGRVDGIEQANNQELVSFASSIHLNPSRHSKKMGSAKTSMIGSDESVDISELSRKKAEVEVGQGDPSSLEK